MATTSTDTYYSGGVQASQYYIHNYYVNTYYHVYKFLESWLADNIFRKDKSRVFMASDDYCFRRRFELTDMSKNYSELDFTSLRFPFANYWPQNSGWIIDPRIAAKSAALTYLGIYEGNTKIRAAQSLFTIPVTLWFDREDDARLAYEIIYFNSYNEHYYSVDVPYGRDTTIEGDSPSVSSDVLSLPMNMEITNLTFNPNFKETDWLKRQRVFPIKVDFQIRSYAILPPEQPSYDVSMNKNGTLSDGSDYSAGFSFYYIVDDVILNMGNMDSKVKTFDAGYDESDGTYSGTTKFPEEGEKGVVYVDCHLTENDKNLKSNVPTNLYIWDDVLHKYVSPDYDSIYEKSIRVYDKYESGDVGVSRFDCVSNVKCNSNVLEWEYDEGTSPEDVEAIELHLVNMDVIQIDPESLSYTLENLNSNTQYYGYIVFYSKSGTSKRFLVNFVTPMSREDELNRKGSANSLVGIKI